MSLAAQPGIRADVPDHSCYLTFRLLPGCDAQALLPLLGELETMEDIVVGLGASLLSALGHPHPGLHPFPQIEHLGASTASTPGALWCYLRGSDRGELLHTRRSLQKRFKGLLELEDVTEGFKFRGGHDLSGYEDGTENPDGDAAEAAAFVQDAGAALDGSSFVAVQRWVHDFPAFDAMSPEQQDLAIGRRISDNEELDDAPPSAHVKRAAQEEFEPEAFMLRRSMPWTDPRGEGLVFIAFGKSTDAFEAVLRRMMGLDDGIRDSLFQFTRPVTGAYFWCPPVRDGRLNLDLLR
jgi:putative iron-dependent peroxidase